MSASDVVAAGTIVMATYNRADRAAATIERLLALPDGWPLIVIDDASTDGTGERLRERFGDRIRLMTLEHNRGGAARNVGVEAARTPLVAFADDDSWWAPGSLTIAARAFDADVELGLVAATVVIEPDQRPDPIVAEFTSGRQPSTEHGPCVLGFLACGAVVRREAFLDVGGFDPLLHVGGEEELLALDLRVAGWSLVHVAEATAHHAPDHDDAGRSDRSPRMLANRLLIAWMRRPMSVAWRETRALAARAVHDASARDAVVLALRGGPTALRRRRRLPADVESDVRRAARDRAGTGAAR